MWYIDIEGYTYSSRRSWSLGVQSEWRHTWYGSLGCTVTPWQKKLCFEPIWLSLNKPWHGASRKWEEILIFIHNNVIQIKDLQCTKDDSTPFQVDMHAFVRNTTLISLFWEKEEKVHSNFSLLYCLGDLLGDLLGDPSHPGVLMTGCALISQE